MSERGIYNLGTGRGYSVKELLDTFNQISPRKIKVETTDRRPGDLPFLVAGATLAKQKLAWQTEFTLRDIIEDTVKVFELN